MRGSQAVGEARDALIVHVEHDIDPLEAEWDELTDRLSGPPFIRPGWVRAWWGGFRAGHLEILTVRRAGRLVAIAPLTRRHGVVRSTSNWHTPEFALLAEDPEAARLLRTTLFEDNRRRVELAFLDASNTNVEELTAPAEERGLRVLVRALERSPFLEIDSDWESYERGLSGNLRRDVGRCMRRLAEQGRVSFEIADGRERLDELLAEVLEIETSGWKAAGHTAIASRPETRRFYIEVARWAAARGWLRIVLLRLDGRPLAFHYAIEEGGVYYPLKGGYDLAYGRFSPGKLIVHWTLKRAFSDGLARYEFLGGEEPYKLIWSRSRRERVLFQAFASSPAGLVDWMAFAYGRPLAKRVLGQVRRT